jgi:chromate transporter
MVDGLDMSVKTSHSFSQILWIFFQLGMTSFGGPVAHLGYFRSEFVERRKWLDETSYIDIVALFQFFRVPRVARLASF